MTTATKTLGDLGDQIELLISQGDSFGPHQVTLVNPDASPVDLTGSTITGGIKRAASDASYAAAFTVAVTNAPGGVFTFGIAREVTAALTGGASRNDVASQYRWDLKLTDSTGRRIPLFFGVARLQVSVTP